MRRFNLTPKEASGLLCTAEHLTARRDGGKNSANNIAAACLHCNRARHGRPKPMDPLAYQALVQRRIRKGAWHPGSITTKVLTALGKAKAPPGPSSRAR
jgi:hypothetical protein